MTLLALCFTLTACGEKNNRTAVAMRDAGPRASDQAAIANTSFEGRVFTNSSYQSQFQDVVVGLLSTHVRPEYIGFVSANGQNNSGVTFGGQITLTNGSILNGMGGTIANTSRLAVQVRDYAPQSPDVPAFLIQLTNAQGLVSGNFVEVTFSDAYGAIMLRGQINTLQRTFTGTMSYDNNVLHDGSRPGAAGTLGDFQIPLCSIFVCN